MGNFPRKIIREVSRPFEQVGKGVGRALGLRRKGCGACGRLDTINNDLQNQLNQMAQTAAANAAEAQARANQLIASKQRLNEELERSKQELAQEVSSQPGLFNC